MIRIMIADDNREFCGLITDYLEAKSSMEVVDCVNDGTKVTAALKECQPDVLLLDLVMPNRDGLEVLEELTNYDGKRPKIIVMSAFGQDHMVAKANKYGVDYYLMKPFSLATLAKRINQIVTVSSTNEFRAEQVRQQLYERLVHYLSRIGMPPHYKGYRYVIDAILLVIQDKTWLHGVTKRLYPEVGKRYNTSSVQVERAIRHAIEITWEKGNLEELNSLFAYSVDAEKGKPTNSAFIAKMADIVDLEVTNL